MLTFLLCHFLPLPAKCGKWTDGIKTEKLSYLSQPALYLFPLVLLVCLLISHVGKYHVVQCRNFDTSRSVSLFPSRGMPAWLFEVFVACSRIVISNLYVVLVSPSFPSYSRLHVIFHPFKIHLFLFTICTLIHPQQKPVLSSLVVLMITCLYEQWNNQTRLLNSYFAIGAASTHSDSS